MAVRQYGGGQGTWNTAGPLAGRGYAAKALDARNNAHAPGYSPGVFEEHPRGMPRGERNWNFEFARPKRAPSPAPFFILCRILPHYICAIICETVAQPPAYPAQPTAGGLCVASGSALCGAVCRLAWLCVRWFAVDIDFARSAWAYPSWRAWGLLVGGRRAIRVAMDRVCSYAVCFGFRARANRRFAWFFPTPPWGFAGSPLRYPGCALRGTPAGGLPSARVLRTAPPVPLPPQGVAGFKFIWRYCG
jgi:hypothetical protein